MKNDRLKQFVSLRAELLREKSELMGRLAEIDKALGSVGVVAPVVAATVVAAPARRGRPPGRPPGRPAAPAPVVAVAQAKSKDKAKGKSKGKSKGKRAKNALSLREVVKAVTKAAPLARQDILKAVLKQGYVFTAKDPLNSLSTLLYSDKSIKNYGGKFGPA
ncbi:MAG: hypothetical protein DVB31_15340 [Verrucomicrobia bacterium]|nr:MAG: hypothetical protein DVB31_15340 [Verrucomicrobiota bacterium]